MSHWIDNADSYICSACGYECNNPNKGIYGAGVCPQCWAEMEVEVQHDQRRSNAGFWGDAAVRKAVDDSCVLAVAALREQERMEQAEESGKPERHGRWIDRIDTDTPMHECSVCGARVVKGLYEYENPNLYCYRCGARMDLGEEGGTNETDM